MLSPLHRLHELNEWISLLLFQAGFGIQWEIGTGMKVVGQIDAMHKKRGDAHRELLFIVRVAKNEESKNTKGMGIGK